MLEYKVCTESWLGLAYEAHLVVEGLLHNGDDALELFSGQFLKIGWSALDRDFQRRKQTLQEKCTYTSALGGVDIGLAADELGITTTDTSNLGESVDALLFTVTAMACQSGVFFFIY